MADMPFTIGRSTSRCCSISSSGSSCTASRICDGTAVWFGGDRNRLWIRTEGDAVDGVARHAEAQVLFGRSVQPLVGRRRRRALRCAAGAPHTWLAIGVQGLAPQFLDVQATAFIGQSGHVAARLEVEHDLLMTQRLVLQPLVELSLSGKDDPDRGIGAGLSTGEVGFRRAL